MRHPALLLVMGSILLSVTSFAAGAEVPPAPPASEAEQQAPASGDVQERGLVDKTADPDFATKVPPPPNTQALPCKIVLPTEPPMEKWRYEVLNQNSFVTPPIYVAANHATANCGACTFFGTNLWKSKVGGALYNTAFGWAALVETNCGSGNTAMGGEALRYNISGSQNTAIGSNALFNNRTGLNNTAVGYGAGYSHFTGNNNIYIENPGPDGESNTIRIGRTPSLLGSGTAHTRVFLAGIGALGSGNPVVVSGDQLGFAPSSRRYKEDIHDLGKAR